MCQNLGALVTWKSDVIELHGMSLPLAPHFVKLPLGEIGLSVALPSGGRTGLAT